MRTWYTLKAGGRARLLPSHASGTPKRLGRSLALHVPRISESKGTMSPTRDSRVGSAHRFVNGFIAHYITTP